MAVSATRNRRTGVNFFTAAWTRLLMTSIGIELNVLGEEAFEQIEPAMDVANHIGAASPCSLRALSTRPGKHGHRVTGAAAAPDQAPSS